MKLLNLMNHFVICSFNNAYSINESSSGMPHVYPENPEDTTMLLNRAIRVSMLSWRRTEWRRWKGRRFSSKFSCLSRPFVCDEKNWKRCRVLKITFCALVLQSWVCMIAASRTSKMIAFSSFFERLSKICEELLRKRRTY